MVLEGQIITNVLGMNVMQFLHDCQNYQPRSKRQVFAYEFSESLEARSSFLKVHGAVHFFQDLFLLCIGYLGSVHLV